MSRAGGMPDAPGCGTPPRKPCRMTRTALFLAISLASGALRAQTPPATAPMVDAHPIPRLAAAPAIDGDLADPAWAGAAEYDLGYEISPGDNTPAPVKSP